jgi:DNA-binding HxlR family transcriptional regulator
LQALLYQGEAASEAGQRRRCSKISRQLRMLRAHGLIQEVPCTHRYHATDAGRSILVAVLTTATTTVHQLNQHPAAA